MKKTDNHNLEAKLALRRALLSKSKKLNVLDCFSGEDEAIWSVLREEYKISSYLALDIKRKSRRLRIDSLKYLCGQRWRESIIDLDAYGSPWEHWMEVIKSDRHDSMTVFLTIGTSMLGNLSKISLETMGVPKETPPGMHRQLANNCVSYCLTKCYEYDWIIENALEALNPGGNARYIGLKLKRK